jgi:hypothetical protein
MDRLTTAFEQALEGQDLRRIASSREDAEHFLQQYKEGLLP